MPDSGHSFNWTRAYGDPVIHGDLRHSPADFRVSELAAIEFTGDGEHDWLWVEKTAANTAWVAQHLARIAGVPEGDVGYAGMKDRHAITTQWFSVRRNGEPVADWTSPGIPGVRVLCQQRHRKKLRRGAHRGNRFEITLRNIIALSGDLNERLELIKNAGVPNYFGEQRFGRSASNLRQARDLIAGKRMKRRARSLALSAARSYIFNQLLDARVRDGSWNRIEMGDCASLDGSNSVFEVAKVDDELRGRCAAMDIHPSGPLWGSGESMVSGRIAELEQGVAAQEQELAAGLERLAAHARRSLRVPVAGLDWETDAQSLRLCFELPAGSYATTVLGELADYSDRSLPDSHAAHDRSSNT